MNNHLSVAISTNILPWLPRAVSSMFLNKNRLASDGIAVIFHLLTHLNPSSSENLLLAISDLPHLEMGLGESRTNYMLRVHGISQQIQGVTMEKNIPLFAIVGLDHDLYPGVKSRYLAGNLALVNCNLPDFRGIIFSEGTRHQYLVLTVLTTPSIVNHMSDAQEQPSPTGHPQLSPSQLRRRRHPQTTNHQGRSLGSASPR